MSDTPGVLRVFLSSTATDMTGCREKVRDTILQLKSLPIGMETFTALPTTPAADCLREAAEADVVIVIVAYRYGCVPTAELGGDGKRSITWLEVLAAKGAGKPVFAFLIDPKAPWTQLKDSDLLNLSSADKYPEILRDIQGLKEFGDYLRANCTFKTFTDEKDLALEVATALSGHLMNQGSLPKRPARIWYPRVCYPLQPAPHFQGRGELRSRLIEWARAPVTPDRVVSLVALGGTGKTALTERVLSQLGGQNKAGILVWSFYENPRTEEFLRVACDYFTDEKQSSPGGILESLQVALSGDIPHLLVLDGLERVQAEGRTGRLRGELEDPQLRRLLRWLAAGPGTRARALVTSRFPLADLNNWKGAGYHEERLDDLEPVAARAVLRGWGVRGDDATLDGLAEPLHYHALSVAVLGSYLGRLWDGDPAKAPTFDRGEQAASDPRAAKLTRILTHYAERLPDDQRDLLARLSAFPRGVTVEVLRILIEKGGEAAGRLAGLKQTRLRTLLDQLLDLGLVFRYDSSEQATYTAHPFLREYFRDLLGVTKPEQIHEAVRVGLAPSLEERPNTKPTDPIQLNRYEALIEHTRLAGRTEEAFALYWFGIGGYRHLGGVLGDYSRGLRILSAFAKDGSLETIACDIHPMNRANLVNDLGLYAGDLGDLDTARRAFAFAADIFRRAGYSRSHSIQMQNFAYLNLQAGRLVAAREAAAIGVAEAGNSTPSVQIKVANATLAAALARLGQLNNARHHFAVAAKLETESYLHSLWGIWEAEFKMAIGDWAAAIIQTQANRTIAINNLNNWTNDRATCDVLLGLLLLPKDSSIARHHLQECRDYSSRSGNVEVQLRAYHLATELARTERDFERARSEAEAGIHLADTCGFGHYGIELRLALARTHLDAGDPKSALQRAREALDRSVHPECQYAWGEADGLHLCGVAHARLGESELARQRLTAALAKREQLTHPGLSETRAELARLGG